MNSDFQYQSNTEILYIIDMYFNNFISLYLHSIQTNTLNMKHLFIFEYSLRLQKYYSFHLLSSFTGKTKQKINAGYKKFN